MRASTFVLVAVLAFPSGTWADDPSQGWEFVGSTQPAATVEVRARVTGYLNRVTIKEGDKVAKGDLLVEIDPRPYQLALEEAKAGLKLAEAELQMAQFSTANSKRLVDKKLVSQLDLDQKTAEEAAAKAALAIEKIEVKRAQLTLSWTRVTAPFNGRVSRLQAAVGGLVTAGQTPILTVVSTDPMHVTFNVPESIVLKMRREGLSEPGKWEVAVGYNGEQGFLHKAQLDLIAPNATPGTATVRFRATLLDPKGVAIPGMSARVRLTAASQ